MTDRKRINDFVEKLSKKGMVMTLDPLKNLCSRLENPQDKIPTVHIAGTNGKGSVLAMVSAALVNAGYRTGVFFSPQVFENEPCVSINGKAVDKQTEISVYKKIICEYDKMEKSGEETPTLFEVQTLASLLCFAEEKCDICVVECGMGGRDDATNIINNNVVSVITAVGIDHTNFLGDTIEQIAENKSDIIKKGCKAVCFPQDEEVTNVIRKRCEQQGCELTIAEKVKIISDNGFDGIDFEYKGEKYKINLAGKVQAENAAVAIEVVNSLCKKGFYISKQQLKTALADVVWHGRFEKIRENPTIIIDGAHNVQAAESFRKNILACCKDKKIVFVMGMLRDKQYSDVVRIIAPLAQKIFTYNVENPRALDSKMLACECEKYTSSEACGTVEKAVKKALDEIKKYGNNGIVCAVGSFYSLDKIRNFAQMN